jgi:hypothetical protein
MIEVMDIDGLARRLQDVIDAKPGGLQIADVCPAISQLVREQHPGRTLSPVSQSLHDVMSTCCRR